MCLWAVKRPNLKRVSSITYASNRERVIGQPHLLLALRVSQPKGSLRARKFVIATLRLTAEAVKNLSALSGVAYQKMGAILTFLVAPNPAPKEVF